MAANISTDHAALRSLIQPFVGRKVISAFLPSGVAKTEGHGTREVVNIDLTVDGGRLELRCFTFGGSEVDPYLSVRTAEGERFFWWSGETVDGGVIESVTARDGLVLRSGLARTPAVWEGPGWQEADLNTVLGALHFSDEIVDVVLDSGSAAVVFDQCVLVVAKQVGMDMRPLPSTQKAYVRKGTTVAHMV